MSNFKFSVGDEVIIDNIKKGGDIRVKGSLLYETVGKIKKILQRQNNKNQGNIYQLNVTFGGGTYNWWYEEQNLKHISIATNIINKVYNI